MLISAHLLVAKNVLIGHGWTETSNSSLHHPGPVLRLTGYWHCCEAAKLMYLLLMLPQAKGCSMHDPCDYISSQTILALLLSGLDKGNLS